jgi:hypothetical protein
MLPLQHDGTISSYKWTQTAGPIIMLSRSTTAKPTFTAPLVAADTTLTFSLIVKDNDGVASAAPDSVNILVRNVDNVPQDDDNNNNNKLTTAKELVTYVKNMHLPHSMEKVLIGSSSLNYEREQSDNNNNKNSQNDKAFCGKLGAFSNKVNATEKSSRLTLNQSKELKHLAQETKSSLGC